MIVSILYFVIILGIIVFVGKGKETVYSIRAIPIGGYCSLAGEGSDEDKKIPKDRLLQSKKAWQRFLVMFFGAGNNFILSLVVLFFLGLIVGCPSNSTTILDMVSDSPVEKAGMRVGDKIIRVDGSKTLTLDDVNLYLAISKGETEITVLRDNKEELLKVTPLMGEEAEKAGYSFGIKFNQEVEYGFINSIKYSFTKFASLWRQMFLTFKSLFTGRVSVRELSGPVGIYSAVDKTKDNGVSNLFYLLALLSLNVGFVNLIPFPAFDGGRILFLIIEKIKGKPVKAETENLIHNIGFFILLALIIYVTINDVIKLF